MTHAEKLILIMLSEIYEHLGIGGADHINARFVRSAIDSNQTWALSRKYPFIFGGRTQTPHVVSERQLEDSGLERRCVERRRPS